MEMPRLVTAMVTPFDDNLEVNYSRAAQLAEYLADNGTQGIVVAGTTGEAPVLSDEEKLRLFKAVKEQVGDKITVWAGTGSNNTQHVIELSREAEKTGVDGILLVAPYYNKPSQEGLYQHFKAVAEAVNLPVMVYNIPSRTSCNILPETMARLAAIENIVAVKESTGDMNQASQLARLLPDKVKIYSGDDSLTLPMLSLGAYGVVSVASHLVGKDIARMIDAFVSGNVSEATRIHLKLFPIFKGLFITTNPIPLKEAMNMLNMQVGGFRLPLTGASEGERATIREMLVANGLI
ncbi:MAG TPA: 4-hydroxy-tetrahydrodipicolinate synthase [Syntrophomonadaceae bacterium]|nr:4-hydroxy-tetrahydrodipicolinate synthase [Syntrophomonadaceae bacterium]HOQ08898.1 4-hydroxy-tetrahydrodipicolinate synthase [Syntrophomonadaceae bacterium]HPU47709.1 4-hydroxy-tetrahydrodipicolinate synthase [Syntrophomonadaceae bacterium]